MPPDNGSYMIAAYIVVGVIYLGYAISLAVRAGRPLDIDAATVAPSNMKVPEEWLLPTYRRGWTL